MRNSDQRYIDYLQPIWDFLAVSEKPGDADAIFVFGGIDLLVPRHASKLWREGLAPKVLVSGNAGLLTPEHFTEPEAIVFSREMQAHGVPEDAILVEDRATNSGENVEFGMESLRTFGVNATSLILVSKPFIMRRCVATFQQKFPRVRTFASPPPGEILDFLDRDRATFARRLVQELDRIEKYSKLGFMTHVDIPETVKDAARLVSDVFEQE